MTTYSVTSKKTSHKVENTEIQNTATEAQETPKVTLLGAISYTDRNDYEAFLNNLSAEHAVVSLIAAANFAQAKGAFNIEEAELIAKAIRKLTVPKEATAGAEPTEETAAPAEKPAKKTATKRTPKK